MQKVTSTREGFLVPKSRVRHSSVSKGCGLVVNCALAGLKEPLSHAFITNTNERLAICHHLTTQLRASDHGDAEDMRGT